MSNIELTDVDGDALTIYRCAENVSGLNDSPKLWMDILDVRGRRAF